MISNRYADTFAKDLLDEPVRPVHAFNPLIQIEDRAAEETRV
jgi:hypothetical protein